MSTLSVGTIQSNTSSPPVIRNSSGTEIGTLCRAFCNFNGTGTVAIRASFNVSSITDNGTGDYTVNFTNAMPDANYSTNITQNIEDSSTYSQHIGVLTASNASYSLKSTSQVRLRVRNTVASNFDPFDVNVAIFR